MGNIVKQLVERFKKNQSALWLDNDVLKANVSESLKSKSLRSQLEEVKEDLRAFLAQNYIDKVLCLKMQIWPT